MRLLRQSNPKGNRTGSVLILVIIFLIISLFTVAAVLGWTRTSSRLTARHNQYYRTTAAAEAATEKVLSRIACDYQDAGESLVLNSLDTYRTLVPTTNENPAWSIYEFRDPEGNLNKVHVEYIPPSEFRQLGSQYAGLHGYASLLRVISNAREKGGQFYIAAGIRQELQVATIPLFQFAIFYNLDMEINPGPPMTISGPVHCNTNIYLQPQAPLTFVSDVTAGASIISDKKPGDPSVRSGGTITFQGEHDARVSALNLPIGTNASSPEAVRQVVEIPPAGESPTSPMGKERFYNKADLVILVSDSGVTVTSGLVNNFATSLPASEYTKFLDTSVTFFNKRENKTVKTTQLDVGKFREWNNTSSPLRTVLPSQDIRTIYVADNRTQSGSTEAGVRLVNGQTLPPRGLTVATPNPLYIQGHYNAPNSALGTSNTTDTVPASIIADAVMVLSTAWRDTNSGSDLSKRKAADTTVNAALLAGIVPTTEGSYSGGVENLPRLLEDWDGRRFTYNGSMVVLYESRYARSPWGGANVYNPPSRNWSFDRNFRVPDKLPPGCPAVRALIRGSWASLRPNSTS
jgi:hypothetical protein